MSYADFERGLTSEQVRKKTLAENAKNTAMEHLCRFKESEHVLNILRSIKAEKHPITNEEVKKWLEITA